MHTEWQWTSKEYCNSTRSILAQSPHTRSSSLFPPAICSKFLNLILSSPHCCSARARPNSSLAVRAVQVLSAIIAPFSDSYMHAPIHSSNPRVSQFIYQSINPSSMHPLLHPSLGPSFSKSAHPSVIYATIHSSSHQVSNRSRCVFVTVEVLAHCADEYWGARTTKSK